MWCFLGHNITSYSIHTTKDKLDAVVKAPSPKNVQQLRSFLGLLNYYGKFIPNLAALVHPLNQLLHKNARWNWDSKCESAFEEAKEALASSKVLTHYDPKFPLTLAGECAYGTFLLFSLMVVNIQLHLHLGHSLKVNQLEKEALSLIFGVKVFAERTGAVISHIFPDGSEHPVAFASRTLSRSEQNYAQLEKESLSLIFGVKRFHQYLYGRNFTLITDHKPLLAILGPKKGIPSLAAAHMQRWADFLSAY